jgi:hypothetical protein
MTNSPRFPKPGSAGGGPADIKEGHSLDKRLSGLDGRAPLFDRSPYGISTAAPADRKEGWNVSKDPA